MKRPTRRLARVVVTLCVALVGFLPAAAQEPPKQEQRPAPKRPRTDSRTPFVHRIPLRDDQDIVIVPPKHDAPAPAAGAEKKEPKIPLASVATTCGKCHDYPAINVGWHFNSADPSVPPGRPGEPWILTDEGVLEDLKVGQANTRTQLPLSYRNWPGTWRPADVGLNDWKFAYAFGRHHPGGGVLETSKDARFNVTGVLHNDCMVCHLTDNSYDLNARYEQIVKKQNYKYATWVASGLGAAEKSREKLKDDWRAPDPADPKASGPVEPPFHYDMGRFNPQGNVTFNVARRTSNDACYQCHSSIGTGRAGANDLAQRWDHDRDIHLVKGMACVDCHKHGLDHMITRGYEGEENHRKDKTAFTAATTLTCAGCHYGAAGPEGVSATGPTANAGPGGNDQVPLPGNLLGGRNAAPRPIHKGLPTLHFEKLSCTACHSGPFPSQEATSVLTSMAHRLGVESFNRSDDAAPLIQQPVFLRDAVSGKIAPHKMMFPTFWGRLSNDKITPITPDLLNTKPLIKLFGLKPTIDLQPAKPLTDEEISKILDAIHAMEPPKATATAAAAATRPATTQSTTAVAAATTAPAVPPQFVGEPVFVTGGKAFKRDGKGKVTAFDHAAAKPYAWALAHDVRGAQQSLGARGCTDCHAPGAPLFHSTISSNALLTSATTRTEMVDLRGDKMGALAAFAATYPMRPMLIATGYTCAVILTLVLIAYAGRAAGGVAGLAKRRLF